MMHLFNTMKVEMLPRFMSLGKIYIVTQQYTGYTNPLSAASKIPLLLTTYDDIGIAKMHAQAVQHDPYAAIINLTNAKHVATLTDMLGSNSHYIAFWAAVADPEAIKKRVERKYAHHIRSYIAKETSWRIGGAEKITPDLQLIFGELFVVIKRGKETLRITFAELEKTNACATTSPSR